MSPDDEKEDDLTTLDQVLRDLRATGGKFPVREETLDRVWRFTPAPRSSPTLRARVSALLDEAASTSARRAAGGTLAKLRQSADLTAEALAGRLGVSVAAIDGIEAGRTHPALFDASFWRGFSDALSLPRAEVARFLASTEQLIAGSFSPIRSTAWAVDIELPVDPTDAEAALRARLAAILAELGSD